MIIAAPGVADHVDSSVESDCAHKEVFDHELVNGSSCNRVKTHISPLVEREVSVRIVILLRARLTECELGTFVISKAMSVGHRCNDKLSCLEKIGEIGIFTEVRG